MHLADLVGTIAMSPDRNRRQDTPYRPMDHQYAVIELAAERFRQAYPLVQAAGIKLSLRQWLQYASRLADSSRAPRGGILAVEDENAYLHGMLTFEPVIDDEAVRALEIRFFVALGQSEQLGRLLLKTAERRAREWRCPTVKVHFPKIEGARIIASSMSIPGLLSHQGYGVEAACLSKRLA